MATIIVDGYNVIRRDDQLRLMEGRSPASARSELLRLLNHPRLSRWRITVVFDGPPPHGERLRHGRAHVRYAQRRTADEVIAELCRAEDVVVTDDRGLSAATLPNGPVVWSVAKLLDRVRPGKPRVRSAAGGDGKPDARSYPRLRTFEECADCLFRERDDWVMLCEEDSLMRRPVNFKRSW